MAKTRDERISELDIFARMMRRLLSATQRVKLAARDFADFTGLPEEHIPAAWVVAELPKELDQIYDDLDEWYVAHVHTPKAPKEVQS
jgi:hypothetical protein